MKELKRILVLVLVAAMVLSTSACSLVSKDEEKDAAQVVATVNGVEILKSDVYASLRSSGFNYYGDPEFFFAEENAEQYKDEATNVLNSLISDEVSAQKAKELGLDVLTDEEMADLEQNAKSYYDYYVNQIEAGIIEQNMSLPTPKTDEEIAEEVKSNMSYLLGVADPSAEALTELFKDYQVQYNLQDSIIADITVDEQDIQDYYDQQLETQTQLLEDDMADLADLFNQNSIEVYNTAPIHYVKHLLLQAGVEDPDLFAMAQSAYQSATTDELKETAKSLLDPVYATLLPKAEALKARAEAGEDFDDLIAELAEAGDGDDGMQSYPEGYAVTEGGGEYMAEFEAASMALTEVGQISDPVATIYGYHVLKLISITPVGPIPFEDVKADIESLLLSDAQSAAIDAAYQEWEEAADIERFENALLN